jgi:hypothetical protein
MMKVKSRKFQIAFALGIFSVVLFPSFLYFSALNELSVKIHPCFEKSNLGESDFSLETAKKSFGLTFIIRFFLRSEYLLLAKASSLFPQVSFPNLKSLILRC